MKVLPFKIPKPIHNNLVVQVNDEKVFYNQLHEHEEIQISLIVQGNGKLIVANSVTSFVAGDIFVINGRTPHFFQSSSDTVNSFMISIFFTKTGFGKGFFDLPELEEINGFFDHIAGGYQILTKRRSIRRIMHNLPRAGALDKMLYFLKLIQKINAADKSKLAGYVSSKKISKTEGLRLQRVFDYTLNNFDKDITLAQIAAKAHMTPHAFCRFFKQRTDKTFFQFLIELRLEHACQMLLDPSKVSIAEIAEKSGFTTISNFNRKFKELKLETPSTYRRRMVLETNY
tara:strand:- start:1334 stop:2191 length:858 start_codon:yes stop_codon:yes gene_type:complete